MSRRFIRMLLISFALFWAVSSAGAESLENTSLGVSSSNRATASASIQRGLRYLYGSGVERNHVRALMWFKLAMAAKQPGAAKYYDLLAWGMTPLQIARAQAFAEICSDSNYTECD